MSNALTGDYSSMEEAAGEREPQSLGWIPGVDFDPDDADEMGAMELVWQRETETRVARLKRENADLRARIYELEGED